MSNNPIPSLSIALQAHKISDIQLHFITKPIREKLIQSVQPLGIFSPKLFSEVMRIRSE
jgi:hypothetical protein